MSMVRLYVKAVVLTSLPAFVIAAATGQEAIAILALIAFIGAAAVFPKETAKSSKDSLKAMVTLALFALTLSFIALGIFIFRAGAETSVIWMTLLGTSVGLTGLATSKVVFKTLVLPKPKPTIALSEPRPIVRALPSSKGSAVTTVEIVRQSPTPLPVPPPLKPKPRETVDLGRRQFPAYATDEGGYMICAPPGRGKTTIQRMLIKPMIEEVLDPRCNSTIIVIDPKREMFAWLASMWPQDSLIPFELFCPSDKETVTLDWDYDFRSLTDRETFALALFPKNPFETQAFFGNAARTVVEAAITAIKGKMGSWDLRILMLVLSNPGYLKKLIGEDLTTKFAAELLSSKSEETAQNVQMEITSKISKWRKVAAHLSQVDSRRKKFSLERFLKSPGVFVIQKDDNYQEQHNAMNSMLLQRIGQILKSLPPDPERERKVYIIIDEFPSLGCIEGFDSMCRELRSRGVVIMAIWQSWANVVDVWKQKADTIQGTLQNFIILGSADPTDAKHAAELIGKARGYEAQRSRSSGEATNWGETIGTGAQIGWGNTHTRHAGTGKIPLGVAFTPTDASSTSGSISTSHSATSGGSQQTGEGVTWIYFERDIKSATEVMRTPLPSRENGFHGIAYRAGEPAPWDFVYDIDLVESCVHKKNRFIPDYQEFKDKYQEIEELKSWELSKLGLEEVNPKAPELYPTQEEAHEKFGSGIIVRGKTIE